MSIDRKALIELGNIKEIVERYVPLKKDTANRWKGKCPFHGEKTGSFVVNTPTQEHNGYFKCFGCNKAGNVIDFLVLLGHTFKQACEEINGGPMLDGVITAKAKPKDKPKVATWEQITPPLDGAAIPTFDHYKHGQPSNIWTYHDENGNTIGHVCRFDFPDGSKETLPYVYAQQTLPDGKPGVTEWRWMGFAKPRKLYNLHLIMQDTTDKSILIVEGEKTAEAAQMLLPHVIVTTWIGGTNAVDSTDWTPLKDKKNLIWPDNDWDFRYAEKHEKAGQRKPFAEQPGMAGMLKLTALLREFTTRPMKWIRPLADKAPNKWDLADNDWDDPAIPLAPHKALKYARENLIDPPGPDYDFGIVDFQEETNEELPMFTGPEVPPDLPPSGMDESHFFDDSDATFKFLGFTNDGGGHIKHHFYSYSTQTIVSFGATALQGGNLLQLAPINFWEHKFPGRSGMNQSAASNWLIQTSNAIGYFSEKKIRGRGAWVDGEDIVLHVGDKLVVNGKHIRFSEYKTKHVYEAGEPMGINTENPLSAGEASKVLEITELLNWEREVNAHLLAGWCVIAPFCGALYWRPHTWLTGAAGTGKSWVFKNIVRRMLGNACIAVQGQTSEAGLRQLIGHDALPVVFDEAEGEDHAARERIKMVLSLARAASADDGGILAKGGTGGGAKTYRIRTCIAFASIGVQAVQISDRSRITIMAMKSLRKNEELKKKRWEELQKKFVEIMTDDYISRLQARTIFLLPKILANAKVFSAAAAAVLGEQRAGDQLGAMIAGAYSLKRSDIISFDDAKKWIEGKNWEEEKDLDENRDEIALLGFLMGQLTVVDTNYNKQERTIGELIQISMSAISDSEVAYDQAYNRLRRIGIKLDGEYCIFSNQSQWIAAKLKDTPWAVNYNKVLMRLDGAKAWNSTSFAGSSSRAVGIPCSTIFTVGGYNPMDGFQLPIF